MLWIILFILASYFFYQKFVQPLSFWKKHNVPQTHAIIFMGVMKDILLKKKSLFNVALDVYNKYPERRYIGTYVFNQPFLVVRDPDLIKYLAVKKFDHFTDHNNNIDPNTEPIFGNSLLALKGDKWRNMRATLSPAFTSRKMKAMFSFMIECAVEFTNYFENEGEEVIEIEMKDAFRRYTNDVIASAVFGVKTNSLVNKRNDFFEMGKSITNFGLIRTIKFFALSLLPRLCKIFGVRLFSEEGDFFEGLIFNTIKYRDQENIIRPDVLHLLLESKKGRLQKEENYTEEVDIGFSAAAESLQEKENTRKQKEPITDTDIISHTLIFFFAGFDTSSTALSFLAHELAENQQVQRKLQTEIDAALKEHNGKITYDGLVKLKYLDMVFSETLRKWPPLPATDRVCVKEYTISSVYEDETPITFEVGQFFQIPIIGLHMDPKYFPNPYIFDPERFSDENKKNIHPYSYLPFGVGPRNCVGSRFAILEVKILIFYLLSKFNLELIEKSTVPIKLAPNFLTNSPMNGFWLGLRKRNSSNNN